MQLSPISYISRNNQIYKKMCAKTSPVLAELDREGGRLFPELGQARRSWKSDAIYSKYYDQG